MVVAAAVVLVEDGGKEHKEGRKGWRQKSERVRLSKKRERERGGAGGGEGGGRGRVSPHQKRLRSWENLRGRQ